MSYISDADRISQPMGQFKKWYSGLFYYSGEVFGWRFIKDVCDGNSYSLCCDTE